MNKQVMEQIEDAMDAVSKAMSRAWQLGQTYWQQADSDFISQHKKSDETQAKFDALVDETRATIAALKEAIKQCGEPVGYICYSLDGISFQDYPSAGCDAVFTSAPTIPDVDWLASVIRSVDGNHTLGAGALAEKIVEAMIAAAPSYQGDKP